jgi:hypothetical protein
VIWPSGQWRTVSSRPRRRYRHRHHSNIGNDRHHNQIVLRTGEKNPEIGASGVFDFCQSVYRFQKAELDEYLRTDANDKLSSLLRSRFER